MPARFTLAKKELLLVLFGRVVALVVALETVGLPEAAVRNCNRCEKLAIASMTPCIDVNKFTTNSEG